MAGTRYGPEIPPRCPMATVLRMLSEQWTTHVLWALSNNGPTRFGELRRLLPGVSSKVLAGRLRRMEADGLIYRHHEPTVPPQVTYGLTERGSGLRRGAALAVRRRRALGGSGYRRRRSRR